MMRGAISTNSSPSLRLMMVDVRSIIAFQVLVSPGVSHVLRLCLWTRSSILRKRRNVTDMKNLISETSFCISASSRRVTAISMRRASSIAALFFSEEPQSRLVKIETEFSKVRAVSVRVIMFWPSRACFCCQKALFIGCHYTSFSTFLQVL